ncbi:MAG: winged helix-turn-helix transcriptional regulator [Phormidesmis sp.]
MTQAQQISPAAISLDELDRDIINLLKVDGRMTYKALGKQLNVPEATARYRAQRLIQSGLIQIQAWPNPQYFGTPHVAIVQLFIENGWIDPVAEQLAELEEVQFVAITAGRHNIVIDVYFDTHADLLGFYAKLNSVSGIMRYETQIVIKLLKAKYKYTFS